MKVESMKQSEEPESMRAEMEESERAENNLLWETEVLEVENKSGQGTEALEIENQNKEKERQEEKMNVDLQAPTCSNAGLTAHEEVVRNHPIVRCPEGCCLIFCLIRGLRVGIRS